MKKMLFLTIVILIFMVSNSLFAQTVEVIDFHSNHRCKTCLLIEKSTKNLIDKEFASEVKSGKVVFKTINVDDSKNAKIAEQFEASGSALWIYRADKKLKVDLTDFAFMNVNNSDKFNQKIREEINKALR